MASGTTNELSLYDVCPTALALLGRPVPSGLDGWAAEEAIGQDFLQRHPVQIVDREPGVHRTGQEYSEEEAAAVAEHLKDLGYIE